MKTYRASGGTQIARLVYGFIALAFAFALYINGKLELKIVIVFVLFVAAMVTWNRSVRIEVAFDGIVHDSGFKKRKLLWADITGVSSSLGSRWKGGRRSFFIHSGKSPKDDIAFDPRDFRRRDLAELAMTIREKKPQVEIDIQTEILIEKYGMHRCTDRLT